MKYSVDLEAPFGLSPHWYAVGIALFILAIILWKIFRKFFQFDLYSPFRIDRAHRDCVREIRRIEEGYNSGELDTRAAHQQMSAQVRAFVQKMTGEQTSNMVYEDLRRLGRPELAELIGTYYEPEFSYCSKMDAKSSIEKGKELVEAEYQLAIKAKKAQMIAAIKAAANDLRTWPARTIKRIFHLKERVGK